MWGFSVSMRGSGRRGDDDTDRCQGAVPRDAHPSWMSVSETLAVIEPEG
jgi:hypothetical protein